MCHRLRKQSPCADRDAGWHPVPAYWGSSGCQRDGAPGRGKVVEVRRIAETLLGLAVLILCAMVGGGVQAAANSGQESLLAGRELPPYLQETLHARQLTQSTESSFITNPEPVGTVVPHSDVVMTAANNRQVRFGLATYVSAGDATYPAISTDAGNTWRIDGPLLHIDARAGA